MLNEKKKKFLKIRFHELSGKFVFISLLLLIFCLSMVPVLYVFIGSIRESLFEGSGRFSNRALLEVYTTGGYYSALWNSLVLGGAVTSFSVTIGGALAWFIGRTDIPMRNTFHFLSIMPLFLAPLSGAMAWVNLAAPRSGYINMLMNAIFSGSTHVAYLNIFSFSGIVWCMTLFLTPIAYLLMVSAFQRMDPALEEAAGSCGAGTFTTLRLITVPTLRPAVFAATLYVFVIAIEMFSIPGYLGNSIRFFTLPFVIYLTTTSYPVDHAVGAAASTMLLFVTLLGLYLYRRSTVASRRFVTVGARGYKPKIMKLGGLRKWATLFCFLYAFLSVILPIIALMIGSSLKFTSPVMEWSHFTTQNFMIVFNEAVVLRAIWNTIALATLVPLGAICLGMLVAYTTQRTHFFARGLIDYISSVPVAVPGIVFSMGLIWVYAGTPVYATLSILGIAYVTRQIPYAGRSLTSGLMQLDQDLENSARVCGANTFQILWLIMLPLLKSILISSWIFIFLAVIRELNSTILLYSPKSIVLSVVVWNYMYEGNYNQASVVALIQTAIICIVLLIARVILRIDVNKGGMSI